MAKKQYLDLAGLETYNDEIQAQLAGKSDSSHNHIYYGVCSTAADTAAKTVTIDNFSLKTGVMVIVKFTNASGIASPTLNVNGTGAKSIYRYGTTAASTGTTTTGWRAGAVQIFIYDGTGWIRDFWENTTYSNVSLGQGYATCTTAAATTAKVGTLSSYSLATGGIVSVKFTYDVPASATLNINNKGAKNIYFRGAAITAGVIKAGDVATFIYSSRYHLISIDRWHNDIASLQTALDSKVDSLSDLGITATATELNYVDGVTSNVQTQLDAKLSTTGTAAKATADASGNTITSTYMKKSNPTGTGSFSLNRKADSTIGYNSVAMGSSNVASGSISHAEGHYTTASGDYSHAEGHSEGALPSAITSESADEEIISAWNASKFTLANGRSSHAEGSDTLALGGSSHAEGGYTTASGSSSHAEGEYTTASGDYSHAEGHYTTASGGYSHAEGRRTTASGSYSHAGGYYTTASGSYSHAEGCQTTASGSSSHAEGYSENELPDTITSESTDEEIISAWDTARFTLAKGKGSHAEGSDTLALGESSHAEGQRTKASKFASHAEGYYALADGSCSHAEGRRTTASGSYSHAEGYYTSASSDYQHVQGKYNIEDTSDTYAHIVGNGTSSTPSNAHTLDWDGNAWFAGNIYIGGTSQSDATLLTALPEVSSSDNGKFLRVVNGTWATTSVADAEGVSF